VDPTPAHDRHNEDLLALVPTGARRLVEVGCSSGALARAYRLLNPGCHYVGIEAVPAYAELARRHCDAVVDADIERLDEEALRRDFPCDCWIFGDVLEHLVDPWRLLARVRRVIPPDGSVVACIPNAQHWSVQARLNSGRFVYEDIGLLDRTHLRWFTRSTIVDLFNGAGFRIVAALPRTFNEPRDPSVLAAIRALASSVGGDPETAARDALPWQYVIRAVPAP